MNEVLKTGAQILSGLAGGILIAHGSGVLGYGGIIGHAIGDAGLSGVAACAVGSAFFAVSYVLWHLRK